jgi:hypothetical protein
MKSTALAVIDERTSDAPLVRLPVAYRFDIVPPGHVAEVIVAHDKDYPAICGPAHGTACACTPVLFIETSDGRRWVDLRQGCEV